MLTRTKTSKWMVESIHFLKPAWCGTHPAGLWPEQGLQPVTRATALRRWFLTLNGERVKLNGVCLHHDAGSVGSAVPERVWERRFETLKEMGCNAIRTSHNPVAPEVLDLCDRMGFLVMNEAFDEWTVGKPQIKGNGYSNYYDEWHERDVTDFVRRDRNHPSVVIWSCGNEIGDQ